MASSRRKVRHVELERGFGLWWVRLVESVEGGIGTTADYGPALTLWGARRRARRILRKSNKGPRIEVVR